MRTLLRPNSLLPGKNTGSSANSGGLIRLSSLQATHFARLLEAVSRFGAATNREFSQTYQGIPEPLISESLSSITAWTGRNRLLRILCRVLPFLDDAKAILRQLACQSTGNYIESSYSGAPLIASMNSRSVSQSQIRGHRPTHHRSRTSVMISLMARITTSGRSNCIQ
jgi:hypothetical protein